MESPQTFLLKKIIGYKENGFESLGDLNAKYIKDISKVILEFAQETVTEVIERLNKGEAVSTGTEIFALNKKVKRTN